MYRRAYALMVGVAITTGALAIIASQALDLPLRDPEGFLGPSWTRIPLLLLGAFLADVVPRAVWRRRKSGGGFLSHARQIVEEHWTRARVVCVVLGLVCFYATYVGYRNLKNFLPFIREGTHDRMLMELDRFLFFGAEPATVLHTVLGDGVAAYFLSFIYLAYLPLVPISVVAWLVWSRNISYGYWYATAQVLCWSLGTASYYAIPSLGPVFYYPWLYTELPNTGVSALQEALKFGREDVTFNPLAAEGVQSVAGFASLHVAVTVLAALVAHYTVRSVLVRWGLWAFVFFTVIATLYFGWHYIADDIAGALIAVISVWIGGLATGQKFVRRGRSVEPTTTTSNVPIRTDPA